MVSIFCWSSAIWHVLSKGRSGNNYFGAALWEPTNAKLVYFELYMYVPALIRKAQFEKVKDLSQPGSSGCTYTCTRITSGMSQGSILGPLGFIIYVDDIPNSVPELSFILYADDTSAFTSNKDISILNNIMSNGLNKLNKWFQSNKLSLNLKKSNFMLFGTRNKTKKYSNKFKLCLANVELSHVDAYKFLGLTVDQSLTWNNHINDLFWSF